MEEIAAKNKNTHLLYCVVVPTYNNAKTLQKVIDGILCYTTKIIIVNDGSTDATIQILKNYPQLTQVHLPKNKGKGNALRIGFKRAIDMGFDYAITIDSDGQHFPEDIPVLIEALKSESSENVLLIGARNMEQEGIPKKSSFGNRFSNFWFWVETGIKLQDTQSGYRLYPLITLKSLRLVTHKFEFEIEVIVKAAWKGTKVKNIPIKVHYDIEDRVSHFRPFKDFARISVLNTYLVIVALFYIKPKNLIQKIRKKGMKRFMVEDILASQDSPLKKALSIALGVFVGLSPFWGFHTMLVIFLALFLKLNKAIAFAFSNISLPPLIPFVLYASSKTGYWVLGEKSTDTMQEITENFELIKHLKTYIIGSFTLATCMALVFGVSGYLILSIFKKKQSVLKHE
ncbi:MAG: DUF2062 domain-containing protein [Flavobacteriaceae bacterium]|nr:DUF2062 domain-containing protein [Flavobacteriaceae bacterium]